MKFLLLLVVLGVALMWWLSGRRRGPEAVQRKGQAAKPAAAAPTMIACAHCGVHLPQPDALFDAGGRPFCSEAHRLAGPRPPQG